MSEKKKTTGGRPPNSAVADVQAGGQENTELPGVQGDGRVEVRGVIAKNGVGQLCFFGTSTDEGVPLPMLVFADENDPAPVAAYDVLSASVDAFLTGVGRAPIRRLAHDALRDLDPEQDPNAHVHDWRVDPTTLMASNPPRERLVCATCTEESSRLRPPPTPTASNDPKDWPKA